MDLIKGHACLFLGFNEFSPETYGSASNHENPSSSSATESDYQLDGRRRTSDRKDAQISGTSFSSATESDEQRSSHGGKISELKCENGSNSEDSFLPASEFQKLWGKKKIWEIKSYKMRKSACENFLRTVRVRESVKNDGTYRDFLDLLGEYEHHEDIDRLDKQVVKLFRDEPEFHIEFTAFLVDAVEARNEKLGGGIEVSDEKLCSCGQDFASEKEEQWVDKFVSKCPVIMMNGLDEKKTNDEPALKKYKTSNLLSFSGE